MSNPCSSAVKAPELIRVEHVGRFEGGDRELFLVASSFEPRSLRVAEIVARETFAHAIVFDYEDTLDTVMGRHHAHRIRRILVDGKAEKVDVLPCAHSNPFSTIRGLDSFLRRGGLGFTVNTVTIDATCFTKLHLLMLLRYLHADLQLRSIRVCYTEPMAYATAFGRQLSYGVRRTVYLPYQLNGHRTGRIALIAFLGHERLRLERIVQELEPELSVVIMGEPGFAKNMEAHSRMVNDSIIQRAAYDRQYRVVSAPAGNLSQAFDVLRREVDVVLEKQCDSIYLAALGTKVQALGFELLRRAGVPIRMLLAYSIPMTYERNMYSQGCGPTHMAVLAS